MCRQYLFTADQKAIQEKNISFSILLVWVNFTKVSLCITKIFYSMNITVKGKTASLINYALSWKIELTIESEFTFNYFCAGL